MKTQNVKDSDIVQSDDNAKREVQCYRQMRG